MKYKNFLLRAVNLLLILGVLWQYQQVALVRASAVSQRKQEIAEVEAYNASVLQAAVGINHRLDLAFMRFFGKASSGGYTLRCPTAHRPPRRSASSFGCFQRECILPARSG